ncbi:MAG: hypothetical protein KAR20_26385 [Candidatus Heimdallarchaeota archaeon]|nr:hypothetical protein [Candidatus Heimdallarchaeota archaeon]
MNKKVAMRFFRKNNVKLAKMKMFGQKPSPSMLKRLKEATRILCKDEEISHV